MIMWTSVGFEKNVREKIIEGIETAYVRGANALCRVGLRKRSKISPQCKPALLQFLQSLVRLVDNITTRQEQNL